ncbi:MAG TPA: chemotaxis protein CheW [Burkholderiales bacterium]|nr:chemotaxis protein CheW [Burkholderiales bacterium]
MAARTSLRDYQRELAERLQSAAGGRAASKLGVQVGAEAWLVDLVDAGEVIPVPPIAQVPLTRPWFRGVANIRGKLYAVVDFPAFLGGAAVAPGEQARLLLLGERFRLGSALLVDRSLGLRSAEQLQARPAAGAGAPWLKAEYSDGDGKQWKELDVAKLVAEPAFLEVAS